MMFLRDVIEDLMPLYQANEVRAGTRSLIDSYLKDNPAFAAEFHHQEKELNTMLQGVTSLSTDLPNNHEKTTLLRTRKLIQRRSYLLAMAVWCTAFPLAFSLQNIIQGAGWRFLGENPMMTGIFYFLAVVSWAVFFKEDRALRKSGL